MNPVDTPATVSRLVRGVPASDGAGVRLTRVIGTPQLPDLDPFLMLDEFGTDRPEDYLAGFPAHPHRGFETVTYMLDGRMRHRDNHGNEVVANDNRSLSGAPDRGNSPDQFSGHFASSSRSRDVSSTRRWRSEQALLLGP